MEQTGGGKTIFTEPVLVVNQKAKDIEISNEYSISTPEGERLAPVRQVGQSIFKKAFRFISDWDSDLRHTLQILDLQGDVVLELTRPSIVVKLKSQVIVRDGGGNEIGRIVQQKALSDGCSLESGGTPCGSIVELADGDADYSIRDLTGTEVACVTETFDESKLRQLAKILFTTANSYLVEIHQPLDDPLPSLVVASALAIDLASEQI